MKFNDRRLFLLLMIIFLLSFGAGARVNASDQQRQQPQSKCPTVRGTCPDSVYIGEKLTFTANVEGGDSNVTPTYNWAVSAGTIESGQGTSTIQVNTDGLPPDSTVTATVDVGGFDRECSTSSSCTSSVMKKAEARKVDEYGALKPKEENARLDNFVIEAQNDPTAQAYIIAYGGRASRAGDAQKTAARAKNYLVNKRGLSQDRVVSVGGGNREEPMVELWIVPSGAQPPQPVPTVNPGAAKPASPAKPKTTKRKKS